MISPSPTATTDYDLIVRASEQGGAPLALGISGGKIAALGPDLTGSAKAEVHEPDDLLLPGWIDAHVHFNEPGRADWEGLATGSAALARGGGTAFFDMPLNSTPPVLDRAALEEKARIAGEKSCLDFALWGGLTESSIGAMGEMAEAGAIGFKAFMCDSGLEEFPASDTGTLRAGMTKAEEVGLPVAVHAEVGPPASVGGSDMAAWLASRPPRMELEAIRIALDLAGETGSALHVVHVSTPEGIDLITAAKQAGVDVSAETCPHYLLLDAGRAEAIGAAAKCAPPLRPPATVSAMWDRLAEGQIDTLGSDHSPAPPEMKTGDDLFAIWGGIAGVQHGLPLLLDRAPADLDLASPISSRVAKRFRLPQKGGLEVGHDADFVLVERLGDPRKITSEDLVTRHPISPYIGGSTSHRIRTTFLRGAAVTAGARGRWLKPTRP